MAIRIALVLALSFPIFVSAGTLILGGGAIDDRSSIYPEFIRLAGGVGKAKIGVITAASRGQRSDPDAHDSKKCANSVCNFQHYERLLRESYGAAKVEWIPVDLDNIRANSAHSTLLLIESMTGFFIGGGDQSRLVACFKTNSGDSDALAALRARLYDGAVIMGTSAGTTIFNAADMVTEGASYEALLHGPSTSPMPTFRNQLTYNPSGGFGFIKSGLIDTHFGSRGREGRIVRLASDRRHRFAYGVDENTALIVSNAGTPHESFSVLGEYGVSIFDLAKAEVSTKAGHWAIEGVRFTYLTSGDHYDVSSMTITSNKKHYVPSTRRAMSPPGDIFDSTEARSRGKSTLINTAKDLIGAGSDKTNYGISYERRPAYKAQMTKDGRTLAWGDSRTISFQNIVLDFFVANQN